jgi:DNA-binding GntR family transcriptional regulator
VDTERPPDPVPDAVLSHRVHEEIRQRIIDGRLRPGDRIRERDLAAELQVSRVPIRQALPALERGGFVHVLPRRSAVVTAITARDVAELYDLRAALEPLIARTAARRVADGASVDGLDAALADAGAALAAGDHDALGAANSAFHGGIELLAGNGLLTTTMGPLHERSTRLNAMTLVSDPDARHREHLALRDAVAAGHEELAAALAFAHVERGRARTIEAVAPEPG